MFILETFFNQDYTLLGHSVTALLIKLVSVAGTMINIPDVARSVHKVEWRYLDVKKRALSKMHPKLEEKQIKS